MARLRGEADWSPRDLISLRYLDEQRALHARPEGYGGKGSKWATTVLALAQEIGATSILDYGCGRGELGKALRAAGRPIAEYDPAVSGADLLPAFADLVVTTDVLEHVEPECLVAVLAHLHRLTRKAVFFVVALTPANKTLSDGRNAHLILESRDWWHATLEHAGFRLRSAAHLPFHRKYRPEGQAKRLIAIGVPCAT